MARGTKDVWSSWSLMTMHCRYGFFDHIDGILSGTDKWLNDDYLRFYEKLQDMAERGTFPDNASSIGYWEATEMFLGGQAAMEYWSSHSMLPMIQSCMESPVWQPVSTLLH